MEFEKIKQVYFLGIGGIGMSALARYFNMLGKQVAGYDKTETELTKQLQKENINVSYNEELSNLPPTFFTDNAINNKETILIYTPAIPNEHKQLVYFKEKKFTIYKRSQVLGLITKNYSTVAVAGTHGKTTTSSIVAHLFKSSQKDCSAFLGGITLNYNTNFLLPSIYNKQNSSSLSGRLGGADWVVVEADEYDRSFLTLFPQIAIITSTDADHLDIYGEHNELKKSFAQFASQIKQGGSLIYKKGLQLQLPTDNSIKTYTYSVNEDADFCATNLKIENGFFHFNFKSSIESINDLVFGIPGRHNVENAIAAITAAQIAGVTSIEIKNALKSFKGVKRRFDFHIRANNIVFIDDYAHHPEELKACINSIKELYPNKKIAGVFQPHLFSRTRDFLDGFAASLDLLDETILLDIYPARELPIKGVTSQLILDKMKSQNKKISSKADLVKEVELSDANVWVTLGAGDIDVLVEPISKMLKQKYHVA